MMHDYSQIQRELRTVTDDRNGWRRLFISASEERNRLRRVATAGWTAAAGFALAFLFLLAGVLA